MMPEFTKTKDQKSKTVSRIIRLAFAALIVFTYFFGLTMPLVGPDEPRYAQVAREMFTRGDWVTPTLGGFDWFEKPALLYWLQIAAYQLFGVSEFAARFGSAMFGLGTIFSLWILGRSLATEDTEDTEKRGETANGKSFSVFSVSSAAKKDFARWLALIAASSIGLLVFSRGASFDIILTFPLTASLVSFFTWETRDCKSQIANRKFLVAFYLFIGVALIAKGLIGIVFPAAIVGFYFLLSWKTPSRTFLFSIVWGTILSLLVAAVWYLPMYQANGWKFVDEFFIQHHFQRFTSDKYKHHQPFWFFFTVLPLMTIPWLPFFLAAIWNFFKIQSSRFKVQRHSALSTQHSALSTFAFAWLAVPLVFFSLSGSKLPGYILPSLPGAIVLTAVCVEKFVRKSQVRARALQGLAAAVFVVVLIALQFFAADFTKGETVKSLIETVDAKGFGDAEFVSLYTVSHNLEFYAAGRLQRESDGKLKRYDDYSVLIREIKESGSKRILVVVPQESVANLQKENGAADIETIAGNGETAIIWVKPK